MSRTIRTARGKWSWISLSASSDSHSSPGSQLSANKSFYVRPSKLLKTSLTLSSSSSDFPFLCLSFLPFLIWIFCRKKPTKSLKRNVTRHKKCSRCVGRDNAIPPAGSLVSSTTELMENVGCRSALEAKLLFVSSDFVKYKTLFALQNGKLTIIQWISSSSRLVASLPLSLFSLSQSQSHGREDEKNESKSEDNRKRSLHGSLRLAFR
jgi:hypothetical protein